MAREHMGHVLRDRLDEKIQPRGTALLIIDMQNDFVHDEGHCAKSFGLPMVSGFQSVIAPIASLAGAARAAGVLVIYTKVVQLPDGSLASPVWLADNLRYGFEPLQCMRGTWGWEIIDELVPEPGDLVVEKIRRTAFQGTNLENLLRSRGIESLIVTGVAGSGCVLSTVRDAIEKDYFTIVVKDCIANNNAELTQACYPEFEALLAPEDFTTAAEVTAVWEKASADDPA
jgi:ureidoacrylate peracid hydrolase